MGKRISIIGAGVVGKATGIGFHMQGQDVLFYDINEEKLKSLKKEGYEVAESLAEAVCNSDISFICVQTPMINGQIDYSYVKRATKDVARALHKKSGYHLVVIRSTVLPSTTRTRIVPWLERYSQMRAGEDFGVCVNPEFLRQTSALQDFLNPSRIVIGELEKRSGDLLENLYAPFGAPIIRSDPDTAEMIKYVSNLFLATKISFFNEMYTTCKALGLQPHVISETVALDPRIGTYGIYGGRPFGGRCLPKDLEAFINFVRGEKLNPKLLEAVLRVNKKMARVQTAQGDNLE